MKSATSSLASRFADMVGSDNVLIDQNKLCAFAVDGLQPSAVVRPRTTDEISEILRLAVAERLGVVPMGGQSKLGIGMPPHNYQVALDLTRMDQVLAFEPGDLTLGVEPGMCFAALEQHLTAKKQFLPLAPAFGDRATIGGIVAAGADSPLRHGYGSVRDQLLGMEFVTGAGVASKSGGRVVKNVTGYDIHQVLVGSLGTLAVITRLNFRTLPAPPEERIFLASFRNESGALDYCRAIRKSPLQPTIVDVLSPHAAELIGHDGVPDCWSTVVGAAGNQAVVLRHEHDLGAIARETKALSFLVLSGTERQELFAKVREFPAHVLEKNRNAAILRIAVLPTKMPELIAEIIQIGNANEVATAVLARMAGILYAAVSPQENNQKLIAACRELMRKTGELGARAMIEWCPTDLKKEMDIWPAAGKENELSRKLKKVFDPHGILSSGRFQGGL